MRGAQPLNAHQPKRSDKSHRQTERRHRGFAKSMRRNPTESERHMWLILKDRRLADYKFRRQIPIGPYIADFVCYSARLIIELDGNQHADDHDTSRDAWLASKGFTILRVWNNQIADDRDAVLDAVWNRLQEKPHG